jgi:hypothetical protein
LSSINILMFKTVSEEVKLSRLAICKSCDFFIKSTSMCQKCGCYMPAKAVFAKAECPINKWSSNQQGQNLINKIEEMILESWNKE